MRNRGVRVTFAFISVAAAIYLADVAAFQLRQRPTGVVTVHPYTAVPRNDKREELIFDNPRDETCAEALFPQQAMTPCWYLRGHPQRRTNL